MQQKKMADQRYLQSKQELDRLQEELKGTSTAVNAERNQLKAKQEKLENERNQIVHNYEAEITKLREQNQKF